MKKLSALLIWALITVLTALNSLQAAAVWQTWQVQQASITNQHVDDYYRQPIRLSDQQAARIGRLIWQNESGGKIEGLTAWNEGEEFASLGIGHFIWYPTGKTGPFVETFPELLNFMRLQGTRLPGFLVRANGCPWPDRQTFMRAFSGPLMTELRRFLAQTINHQVRFAAIRLEKALPQMLSHSSGNDRTLIIKNFYRVAGEPDGFYALMDYVNFKGEGTSPAERYRGHGWGLLQVLREMGDGAPLQEFSQSAIRVLTRRVTNSPPERNEKRWLAGWTKRCQTYSRSQN